MQAAQCRHVMVLFVSVFIGTNCYIALFHLGTPQEIMCYTALLGYTPAADETWYICHIISLQAQQGSLYYLAMNLKCFIIQENISLLVCKFTNVV